MGSVYRIVVVIVTNQKQKREHQKEFPNHEEREGGGGGGDHGAQPAGQTISILQLLAKTAQYTKHCPEPHSPPIIASHHQNEEKSKNVLFAFQID